MEFTCWNDNADYCTLAKGQNLGTNRVTCERVWFACRVILIAWRTRETWKNGEKTITEKERNRMEARRIEKSVRKKQVISRSCVSLYWIPFSFHASPCQSTRRFRLRLTNLSLTLLCSNSLYSHTRWFCLIAVPPPRSTSLPIGLTIFLSTVKYIAKIRIDKRFSCEMRFVLKQMIDLKSLGII